MAKSNLIFGVVIALAIALGSIIIIPRVLASKGPIGDDDDKPNPVTSIQFTISPTEFTDGESVGFFWNVIGGSGRFTAILRPGDGSKINISEGQFSKGKIFHVMDVGNLQTQCRRAIFQINDIETNINYNEFTEYIVHPIDDIPSNPDFPIVISQNGPFRITLNNELIAKINFQNVSNRDSGPIEAIIFVKNPNNIGKWLAITNLGNIKPNAITTIEFKTGRLATFSNGLEWSAEFFAVDPKNAGIFFANVLRVGFTLPRENNP